MSLVLRRAYHVTDLTADPNDPFRLYELPAGTPLARIKPHVLAQLGRSHFVDNGDGTDDSDDLLGRLNTQRPTDAE